MGKCCPHVQIKGSTHTLEAHGMHVPQCLEAWRRKACCTCNALGRWGTAPPGQVDEVWHPARVTRGQAISVILLPILHYQRYVRYLNYSNLLKFYYTRPEVEKPVMTHSGLVSKVQLIVSVWYTSPSKYL
jgi:hypothetical protein